jgi:Nucleotidyl transferase of unknown function (DUF2204)
MDIMLDWHKDFLLLLLKHDVEFILIGGYAVIYYGYERTTADMDIWLRPDNTNRSNFIKALIENGINSQTANALEATDFSKPQVMHIGEKPNHIDFLTKVNGVTFDDAWQKKAMLPLKNKLVPVIQYHHLILTKISTGRLQDKADIEKLQNINRFRQPPL